MGKAIAKGVLFTLIIVASCVAVNWVVIPNNPDAYQAAKLDKLDMIRRTPSPKVVLVGGSNLAFSIDSQLLRDEFGFPVVNMGLAKSVGLNYLIEEARPYINEGDIVIVAPEYELFFDMFSGSDGLIVELQFNPEGIKHLNTWGEWKTVLGKFAPIMQAKFAGYIRSGRASLEDSVYRRSGFNDFGDLETHLDADPAYRVHELFPDQTPFQRDAIEILNEFNTYALKRGARVLLTWPPLVESEFKKHQDKIMALDEILRATVAIPMISNPSDYVFPLHDMYDTAYHLRREGRRVRTYQLINDLEVTQGIGLGGKGEPT